ncbi:MAG: NGG1p interacting factor 3 protein [Gemmatimonadetes bacterium]|nr:NGG1p interacting factor 3 protein [Gemmatimonadota bacterium]
MSIARLSDVVGWLDDVLRTSEVPDYDGALNGLQLANRGEVTRVAAAVDFSRRTVDQAIASGADLLILHHGMFWSGARPIVGPVYERLALLMAHGVAVYASHLPLDLHAEYGNNALLARALGLQPTSGFGAWKGLSIGVSGESDLLTSELLARARQFASQYGGSVVSTPFDAVRHTRHWGMVTGAGASSGTLCEAQAAGIDTLVVGEGPHHTAVDADDSGLVVLYAGHYATETLGVQALARAIESRFGLPWSFLHAPTGL